MAVSTVYAKQVVMRQGRDGAEAAGARRGRRRNGVVSLQYPGGLHLEMVDLKVDVRAGRLLPVTFRFEKPGTVTVNVFVDGFGLPTVSPVSPASRSREHELTRAPADPGSARPRVPALEGAGEHDEQAAAETGGDLVAPPRASGSCATSPIGSP